MLASELLHADVIDADGRKVGRVHDLKLVRDGPALGPFGASYRLHQLVVGKAAVGTRLGFYRGALRRPAAIATLFRALERHAVTVSWGRCR